MNRKLWLCTTAEPCCYYTLWLVATQTGKDAATFHPRGLLRYLGGRYRYLDGKAPVYDARYHNLEPDGSFDPYRVGTLYYDQIKSFPDGPGSVRVLRSLGAAPSDLPEGVVVVAALGVEHSWYLDKCGAEVGLPLDN